LKAASTSFETQSVEEIEIKLLLEAISLRYGYDFREYAVAPLRRGISAGMTGEGVPTISAYQERLLRDEGRAYADRLIEAGIKTTYVNYPGTIHGFFSLTRFLQQGLKANDEAAAVLGAHFGT